MSKPQYTGLMHVIKATEYSIKGLISAWRHESAFRQECIVGLVLLPCAFLLGQNLTQVALLIGSGLVVLMAELLNSAVEAAVDRMGEEFDDLAGRAKDMGSAAVSMGIVLVFVTWGLVALDRITG
jgi:diacylglycerol kinase (ATP)